MRKYGILFWALISVSTQSAEVTVRTSEELRHAFSQANPGDRIRVAPGKYRGGISIRNVSGRKDAPIVIAAADEKNPPVFEGGNSGMMLSDCNHLELRGLHFSGARVNGLNIDDGGSFETPSTGIVLSGLRVSDVGDRGNNDGIKLSGLTEFRVENCVIERWGRSGSGIDMVGCRNGAIEKCVFRHQGPMDGASGVQAKGGSESITIRHSRFENAGQRGVNLGGSTGLAYFRPKPRGFEAREIVAERNVFIGGLAPVCFVGSVDCVFRFNTVYRPAKWVVRILQENNERGFVPCQRGVFKANLIVFDTSQTRIHINVGGNTAPETFKFEQNYWYCRDRPAASRPRLPVNESSGVYGREPLFYDESKGDFRGKAEGGATKASAYAR